MDAYLSIEDSFLWSAGTFLAVVDNILLAVVLVAIQLDTYSDKLDLNHHKNHHLVIHIHNFRYMSVDNLEFARMKHTNDHKEASMLLWRNMQIIIETMHELHYYSDINKYIFPIKYLMRLTLVIYCLIVGNTLPWTS